MRDQRLEKLAQLLVNYSVKVKAGELVRIAGEVCTAPLAEAVFRQVIAAGAHPFISLVPATVDEVLLKQGLPEQLAFVSPITKHIVETIDVSIGFWGTPNTKSLSNVDPQRQAAFSASQKPVREVFMQRAGQGDLRWVGTMFPTYAAAQDAEMSLEEYEEFVFGAGHLDADDPVAVWEKIHASQQAIVDFLNTCHEIRITTPQGTDITFGVEGRTWLNCAGDKNFPDGEVFTGPIETATEGVVCYSFPAVHGGREAHDIRLVFKSGRVVEASASKGEDFLISMLDQDEGARVLGELAFGTNYNITRYTKNTLFDEKIGGTFHAAVGAAYPETGGTNQSGLHWDMVCDLRHGGVIEADGQVISKDGCFTNKSWPQPMR